ncbi:hypothetical protein M8J75_006916 [Diaphorina citri]|nr:hypothetical protein M8J75_006916 [Diaphorina citri]
MEFCRTLSLLSHLCLVGILGKENFECGEIERFRNELSSVPPTYDFVWKVTATSPPTKSPEAGTKERGIIMDALHHTMMDYEFRQMWMSLMRHNYTLFMSELKEKGEKGVRRWKFLIQYFENMNFADFERILSLFDYERHQYERITMTTFSSPPLPEGYWDRTDPTFWHRYTENEDEMPIDPWKYTLPESYLTNLHMVNPRMFTTPDK